MDIQGKDQPEVSTGEYDRYQDNSNEGGLTRALTLSKPRLVEYLWSFAPEIYKILRSSENLHEARDRVFDHLNGLERHYFNIYSDKHFKDIHILEKNNAKECIRVLKNIIRSENERLTGYSALQALYNIAKKPECGIDRVSQGFLVETLYLIKGIYGRSEITTGAYSDPMPGIDNRMAALNRSNHLDRYSYRMNRYFKKYKSGLDKDMSMRRAEAKAAILRYFNASEDEWEDYRWHMEHIIKDVRTISSLVRLEQDEVSGLEFAERSRMPFQITPYYLSLFNMHGRCDADRAVRAQVLPSLNYCLNVLKNRNEGSDLDFMGEKSTSPLRGITRRYPQILILKPYDSCPQICVYCQRNWELKGIDDAKVTRESTKMALDWIKGHESITEVLVTGGDPLTLNNKYMKWLAGELADIGHIERVRIGTRVPVTLPQRVDDELVEIFGRLQEPGRREVCIVTHFEHPVEVTADAVKAVQKFRHAGMSVYNQQVFTYYNSRKFETALLRKVLKVSGVDPYYTFNTKGKEETIDFRVPIARIEQERKEEARLLPGLVRTDEPVFNVPRLGKSHLRAWQDHEVIMLMGDGRRAYRFYPWESKLAVCDAYIYQDVSIYDYLKRIYEDNEDVEDYRSIWYYF